MFQCIEYKRQREYDASEAVTAEDPEVRHGMSKVDSNICFKVEGRRSMMLLLCVDALCSRNEGVENGIM